MAREIKRYKKFCIFVTCIIIYGNILSSGLIIRCFAEESGSVTDFDSLQAAINENTGASIEIANDINFPAVIAVNKNLTFKAAQGSGEVRLTAAGGRHFNISGGNIILTFDGNVVLNGDHSAGGINSTAANFTLNDAVIQDCVAKTGGGIYATGNVAVNGCRVSGNSTTSPNGGGILASSVTVNDCVFSGNSSVAGGGGAIWSNAGFTAHNAIFMNNTSFVGAGVYAVGGVTVYDSFFTGNIAQAQGAEAGGTGASGGGAIYSRGDIVVDNCTISGNKAGNGGGICSYQSTTNNTIIIKNGTQLTSNQSLSPTGSCGGGAIYSTNSRIIIEDGEVTGNSSVTGGGAIYSDGGLIVLGGIISQNTAKTSGGAARVYGSVMSVSGGEISGNTSGTTGGAIMTGTTSATVSDTARITGNISNGTGAYDCGGGLSIYNCALTVSGGEISGNTATHTNGGGIGDYWGSAVNVTGGTITGNHAPAGDGGGIYIRDLAKVTIASTALFSGNTASRAFWMTDPDDIALHNANIHTTSRSAPSAGNRAFTYLFNNYDVNYTKGNTQDLLPIFSIAVTDDGNGVVGSDNSTAYEGETITLTATPQTGYTFKEWIIISGNIAAINSDGTFIMPDSDVAIQAIFEPVPTIGGVTKNNRIIGSRIIDYGYNYDYGNYTIIEEAPPPLAGLPPENNIPDTGKQSSTPYIILGASMTVFGIITKGKYKNRGYK